MEPKGVTLCLVSGPLDGSSDALAIRRMYFGEHIVSPFLNESVDVRQLGGDVVVETVALGFGETHVELAHLSVVVFILGLESIDICRIQWFPVFVIAFGVVLSVEE